MNDIPSTPDIGDVSEEMLSLPTPSVPVPEAESRYPVTNQSTWDFPQNAPVQALQLQPDAIETVTELRTPFMLGSDIESSPLDTVAAALASGSINPIMRGF